MWVKHEVTEGPFQHPLGLVVEGGLVGDGESFGLLAVVPALHDLLQLFFGLFVVRPLFILFHQPLLDVLAR